jgi:regulation of enolase protein 1 (concanavalin A-like superfamily)
MNTRARQNVLLTIGIFLSSGILLLRSQEAGPGEFEAQGDVGSPKLAGSAGYDAASREYTLTGAGTNMWFTTDQFHFLWRKMKGDFVLRARIEFIGKGGAHRKVGWMVRPSLDAGAPYADGVEHGDGLTSLQFRRAVGSNTEQIALAISNANVLQFERRGTTYIFSAARSGEPLVSGQLTNFDLGDEVYAGLFICSHSANVAEKAIFRDVQIIRPAP